MSSQMKTETYDPMTHGRTGRPLTPGYAARKQAAAENKQAAAEKKNAPSRRNG